MHRSTLLQAIAEYRATPDEKSTIERFKKFVEQTPACFERSHKAGHVTGSAFVLSPDKTHLLLSLHAKLKQWLQLGGHSDGHHLVHEVAEREAREESGLTQLKFFPTSDPIDFDIHEIPANTKEAAHFHYDVRYVFVSGDDKISISHESLELKWVALQDITRFTTEPSLMRVVHKILNII